MRKKSIKGDLIKKLSLIFISIFAFTFLGVYTIVNKSLNHVKNVALENTINEQSKYIEEKLQSLIKITTSIASDDTVRDMSLTPEEKRDRLMNYTKELNIRSIGMVNADGDLVSTDGFANNISQREYFQKAMNEQAVYISNPSFVKGTDEQIIFIAVPLKNDDKSVGMITCTFDSSFLSEQIKHVKYFDGTGTAYILNGQGTVIASDNFDEVLEQKNYIEDSKENKDLETIAEIHTKMIKGESNVEQFETDSPKYIAYAPIENTDNWTIGLEVQKNVVEKERKYIVATFVILGIIAIGLLIGSISVIGQLIGKRLNILKDDIEVLAQGVFNKELDSKELNEADEIGEIFKSLKMTQESIVDMIKGVKENIVVLSEQSGILEEALEQILNGSENISSAMNESADANTNQAQQILEISNSMSEFGKNINIMVEDIKVLSGLSEGIENRLSDGNDNINELGTAVDKFEKSFERFNEEIVKMSSRIASIGNITSTIESIAEQTEMLALNAAIEAARAGEAGKGFSVVAEEVRKLAEQSKASVNEIGTIVNNVAVESKTMVNLSSDVNSQVVAQREKIEETIRSFNNIADLLEEVTPKIKTISDLSYENNEKKDNIAEIIETVSAVSEELSATTEEVAATGQEFTKTSKEVSAVSNKVIDAVNELNNKINDFTI